jgi:hypothetical protein
MHERCLLAEEPERMFTIGPHKGVLHLNHELAVDGTFFCTQLTSSYVCTFVQLAPSESGTHFDVLCSRLYV